MSQTETAASTRPHRLLHRICATPSDSSPTQITPMAGGILAACGGGTGTSGKRASNNSTGTATASAPISRSDWCA